MTVEEEGLLVDVAACRTVLRPRFVTRAHDAPCHMLFPLRPIAFRNRRYVKFSESSIKPQSAACAMPICH
jgi:hypothetical protein